MKRTEIAEKLSEKGLRVTPQRMAILEAITGMENHPTAENVIEYIKEKHPNISGRFIKCWNLLWRKNC